MPEEIFILSVVAIVFGCVTVMSIVRNALKYRSGQATRKDQGAASMTTSELQAMLRAAVEEATRPLSAKIDALEARLSDEAVPPRLQARGGAWLDEADDVSEEAPAPVRPRVR